MLVLSRKKGETIVIGQGVTVTVLALKGGAVRLGVEAPDGVIVDRAEVSKRRQNGDGESDASRSKTADVGRRLPGETQEECQRRAALGALRAGRACDPELAAVLLSTDETLGRGGSVAAICAAVGQVGRTW